jgi:DNA-binding response OmpR family regulator
MIRRLRMRTPAPIIILGMSLAPVQKATFLEAGADDVMDVSWSVTEIAFRLQKFKERTHEQLYIHTTLSHGPVKLHVRSHTVSIDSKHVHLTQTEYRILEYLLFHKDQNIPRERLASATLPLQSSMKYNTQRLLVHLSNLRKKLAGSLTIRTLPDGSYKLL